MIPSMLGTRAIFTTHFHALATDLDVINAFIPGDSNITSLVSCVEEEKRRRFCEENLSDDAGNHRSSLATQEILLQVWDQFPKDESIR